MTKRTFYITREIKDGTAGTSYYFSLSDLASYTEFTALFDLYKLCGVRMSFRWGAQAPANASVFVAPEMTIVRDYDDGSVPGTKDVLLQYQGVKTYQLNACTSRPINYFIKPCLQKMVYKTVASTGYTPGRAWLSTADPTVPHFGVKAFFDGSQNGGVGTNRLGNLNITLTYYLAFKNVK